MVAGDRRNCCQTGKPILSRPYSLVALVGQDKVDGRGDGFRVGIEPQEFVGSAVGAGSVGAHAEAGGDWLEILLLFVNAVAGAPPPGLVDKRPVRRIHETDDAVVDAAGQVSRQVRDLELVAERGYAWHGNPRSDGFGESCPRGKRVGNENPDVAVLLLAGVAADIDAVGLQSLLRSQRRDQTALA